MIYYSLPVFAAVASVLVLHETIAAPQVLGGLLVISGILVATLVVPRRRDP